MRQHRSPFVRICLLVSPFLVAACDGLPFAPDDDIICTAEYRSGLQVEVRDAETGAPAGTGATVRARAPGFTEELHAVQTEVGAEVLLFHGVGERAGTYEVSVERPGYESWRRAGVTISRDACHVIPIRLEARLVPTD